MGICLEMFYCVSAELADVAVRKTKFPKNVNSSSIIYCVKSHTIHELLTLQGLNCS